MITLADLPSDEDILRCRLELLILRGQLMIQEMEVDRWKRETPWWRRL